MEPRTRYAKSADGTSIAYAVLGKGTPVVAASMVWGDLHLYQNAHRLIRPMYDSWINAGLQIAIYDGRRMGASDHSVVRDDLTARMEDLAAVADAAGFSTFALASIASGAPIAIAYAAGHPERVDRLVLINGYARGEDWYRSVPSMRIIDHLKGIADDDWETYVSAMASAVMQFADPEISAGLAAAFRSSTSPKDYLDWMAESKTIDVSDLLPEVKARTLVVFSSQMIAESQPLSRELAARIPDAELVELQPGPSFTQTLSAFLGIPRPEGALAGLDTPAFRTILFSDLAGHSEMMSRLGDERGREVLRDHERITREVLKANGGTEVKTMGDGFMASFGSVTRAVECAIALQRAFAEHEGEELSVRVGLNAGEPIEEDGDLFGATVILASRIAAKAEGGEILVADTVRGLCSGKGFLFSDRGEFVAKGFEEPVRVYEIRWKE